MDRTLARPEQVDASRDEHAAAILAVDLDASLTDIRAAYRRRARETHPDRGGADTLFRDVQWAYEWLTEEETRARLQRRRDERVDTIVVAGRRVERRWNTHYSGYQFVVRGTRAEHWFHVRRRPPAIVVRERQFVQAPAALRKQWPGVYIVLHGVLFPVTRTSTRLLALDVVYLDPNSASPYALVARNRSWLLVRQPDGRLLAQNSKRTFSRLGGYAAFSDASGRLEPLGERIFPPFEGPLRF